MRLDDRTGNRQAQAHAVCFACRERFEKILLNPFGESNTSINHVDPDRAVVHQRGGNRQFVLDGSIHRFDGVADQIDQDLLDLNAIHEDAIDVRAKLQAKLDIRFADVRARDLGSFRCV